MTATSANAFLGWFSQWGQVIYITVQMLFWVAIAAAALIVALQYKRLVSFKVGGSKGAPAAGREASEARQEAFVD